MFKDKTRKKITAAVLTAVAVTVAAVIVLSDFCVKKSSVNFFAMDTYITAGFEGVDAENACSEFRKTVENLDEYVLSRQNENSEVSKLNTAGNAGGGSLEAYIRSLIDLSKNSGGAFDFTLGAVSDLWGFGNEPHIPDEKALAASLTTSGFDKVSLTDSGITVKPGAVIDFGSTGKGIALDETKKLLDSMKIRRATVSVGGSVLFYGGGDFTVGIRNPRGDSASYIMTVSTKAACISTSGSYEQCFEENGRKYHHIINPKTGYPVDNGLVSVTVISENGLLSDGLSTACFVLGIEKGSALAEKYGCEAIFVTDNNKIYTTAGIGNSVKITDSGYSFAR